MAAYANAPSLSRLMAAFPSVDPENLKKVRELIHAGKRLAALNSLMGTFGVETIIDAKGYTIAYYLNSGDTYAPTLLRRASGTDVQLTTLGDFVKAYERRHAALP